jgi:NADH:ubiquinone oxidoreductase subunit 6 (subunit J)
VTVADALMLALGAIAVGAGALVVTSTHLVRAGFYLVVSLGAIAGLYLVLGAELVAWVQILVYVGAVVVLLLFAVMLTRAPIGPSRDLDRPAGPAALIGGGVGLGLTVLLMDAFRWTRYELPPPATGRRVGEQIFGAWVLPFEVLSILLLAALVGAIVLSRPDIGARPGPQTAATGPPPSPIDESAEVVARLERIAARQAAAQARVRAQHAAEVAAANQAAANQAAAGQTGAAAGLGSDAAVAVREPSERSRDDVLRGRTGDDPLREPTRDDILREQARDVVFGARKAAPTLGSEDPPPPDTGPRRVENTVGEPIPDASRAPNPGAGAEARPQPLPDDTREPIAGRERPALPPAPAPAPEKNPPARDQRDEGDDA